MVVHRSSGMRGPGCPQGFRWPVGGRQAARHAPTSASPRCPGLAGLPRLRRCPGRPAHRTSAAQLCLGAVAPRHLRRRAAGPWITPSRVAPPSSGYRPAWWSAARRPPTCTASNTPRALPTMCTSSCPDRCGSARSAASACTSGPSPRSDRELRSPPRQPPDDRQDDHRTRTVRRPQDISHPQSHRQECHNDQHGNRPARPPCPSEQGAAPPRPSERDLPIPRSDPGRAAWETAVSLDPVRAVAIVDSLLGQGLAERDTLAALAARNADRPGGRRARWVFDLADGRAESPSESHLRVRLVLGGLPRPAVQHPGTPAHRPCPAPRSGLAGIG